jgi:hypothetical protein
MTLPSALENDTRGSHRLVGLCILAVVLASCGSSPARNGAGGSGGEAETGGNTGSGGKGTGGVTGGSGGGTATGGSTGDTGGSVGSGTGGSSGSPDASVAAPDAAADTGGAPAADAGGGSSDNPCYNPKAIKNRTLPGLSVKDFCDAYEKYCMYTPDGSMMSKCGPGQPVGPLYRDRMDCETKYGMASAGAKACRAGQMCVNAPAGLIVNACSHATGYCAGACK